VTPRSVEWLLAAQRALRSRFNDLAGAMRRNDVAAVDVALDDFARHLCRWTEAEEAALMPAVSRVAIPGRDPRRELRLEYVQLRELTRFLQRQREERVVPQHLAGYVENLERRLAAHEREMLTVYYPVAAGSLTNEEWMTLEGACPPA